MMMDLHANFVIMFLNCHYIMTFTVCKQVLAITMYKSSSEVDFPPLILCEQPAETGSHFKFYLHIHDSTNCFSAICRYPVMLNIC